MRVLIAGCGDLGQRIAARLVSEAGNTVWGIRRHPPARNPVPGMHWIAGDLARAQTLTALPDGITHVIYAAAPDARNEAQYRAIYREGLENLLRALASPALVRVVFISSTAVYGEHGDDWVDEETPCAPPAFNGHILLETERWLADYAAHPDARLTASSLRLSGIYGPGRTYLLDRLRLGQAGAPAGLGNWVNRVHIEDAARAVCHVLGLSSPQSVYVVTDDTPLPMRTLYADLARLVGGPVPPVAAAPAGVGSKRLSNARLRATGFSFTWGDSRVGHASLLGSDQAAG